MQDRQHRGGIQQARGEALVAQLQRVIPQARLRLTPALYATQGRLQALQPHGLGEVVERRHIERAHGVLGMRGHKHDGRGIAQLAQAGRQHHAIEARHLDVEQDHVGALPHGVLLAQPEQGRHGFTELADHLARRLGLRQQGAQAQSRQGFVVDQGHRQRRHADAFSGKGTLTRTS